MEKEKSPEKVKLESEVSEMGPFVGEGPVIIANGKEYKVRRLNITDIFKLGRILGVGAAGIGKEIGKMELDPSVLAGLLLVSFPYAEKQCLELIASILDVKIEELKDPAIFPVDSVLDVLKVLIEHEDIKAFFIKLVGLLKMPIFKGFSKKD